MTASQPEPSPWEKKWKRWDVFLTAGLTLAGLTVAALLGIVQWRLQTTQAQTSQNQAMASLIIALGDKEDRVRTQAAIALAQFGEPTIGPLSMALGDENEEVRSAAVRAFVNLYELHRSNAVVERMKDLIQNARTPNAVEASVLVLAEIAIDQLVSALTASASPDSSSTRWRVAVDALGKKQQVEALKKLSSHDGLPEADRAYVIGALADVSVTTGRPEGLRHLVDLGKQRQWSEEIRVKRVIALGDAIGRRSWEKEIVALVRATLLETLKNESDRVRAITVSALKELCRDDEVRAALQRVAAEPEETNVLASPAARLALGDRDSCGDGERPRA